MRHRPLGSTTRVVRCVAHTAQRGGGAEWFPSMRPILPHGTAALVLPRYRPLRRAAEQALLQTDRNGRPRPEQGRWR